MTRQETVDTQTPEFPAPVVTRPLKPWPPEAPDAGDGAISCSLTLANCA